MSDIKNEYDKLKKDFGNKKSAKSLLPFAEATKNKYPIDWENFTPVKPSFTGTKVFEDYDLNEIYEYHRLAAIFYCLGNAWKISTDFDLMKK